LNINCSHVVCAFMLWKWFYSLLCYCSSRHWKTHPIKCLGKWFVASLKDHNNVNRLRQHGKDGMQTIDKTLLPGKYNAWMYQHGLLPRLIWPLTLYEIPTTAVEVLERTASKHLRKWFGVPPSFTNIVLYGKTTTLQLPLS